MAERRSGHYDAVVIGSGFGGALAAWVLMRAGLRVVMLERGDWLQRGPHNWEPGGVLYASPHYTAEPGHRVVGERSGVEGVLYCVGGLSVFYGGVALRLREDDFRPHPETASDSGGRWPFGYGELERYYAHAERILGVAGDVPAGNGRAIGADPTAPRRSAPYPHVLPEASATSRMLGEAAARLGLHPFRLPLAINHGASNGRSACVGCITCDAFACAIGAKNDLASAVIPDLIARGMRLEPNTVAVRLVRRGARIDHVECVDRGTGERRAFHADEFILAAGALGSPHLLLASGLQEGNPGGDVVGRYLMRHCNAIVYGLFQEPPNPQRTFHKELGIHDFYLGHPRGRGPSGKLGSIQQVHGPPIGLALERLPRAIHAGVPWLIDRMTGLLVIAEDQPQAGNRVVLDSTMDRFGMPHLVVHHRYSRRDHAARAVLVREAKRVLREAGARFFYRHTIHTFSHAVGTVRMGEDPLTSALDAEGRFRGVENLRVADGSFMPFSGAVNPSLTIAAHALRTADLMTSGTVRFDEEPGAAGRRERRRPVRVISPDA
jgi:choline dehydrogenase-like flavoprotein